MSEFSPYQQKVIKRYYDNADTVQLQRLAEMVTDLYLAEGKQKARAWKQAAACMQKLGVQQTRIDHLMEKADPKLLANLVTELQGKN
jgi:hypothetical protein